MVPVTQHQPLAPVAACGRVPAVNGRSVSVPVNQNVSLIGVHQCVHAGLIDVHDAVIGGADIGPALGASGFGQLLPFSQWFLQKVFLPLGISQHVANLLVSRVISA